MGGQCYDCGITDIRVIEWDHVTGKQNKTNNPNRLSMAAYWEEVLNHCEPVCANCHRLRTIARGQCSSTYREECHERTEA